jgi:sugar phosphate isomerase/epimerase
MQVHPMSDDPDYYKRIKDLCAEKDVEPETYARGVFDLLGPDAKSAREQVMSGIKTAQMIGANILRTGYGRLNVATSKFSRDIRLADHMAKIVASVKEAAKMFEDNGVYLAIENHCDFTGREWVEMLEAIGSKHVGSAYDTANGYTAFWDANDDCEVLAPYAITTHMKDMVMRDTPSIPELKALPFTLIPYLPFGCALGEGNVDIPRAVDLLAEKSPHAEGLHLIIELGWDIPYPGKTQAETRLDMFHRSVQVLKGLTQD